MTHGRSNDGNDNENRHHERHDPRHQPTLVLIPDQRDREDARPGHTQTLHQAPSKHHRKTLGEPREKTANHVQTQTRQQSRFSADAIR